jgi:biopolymer transport protein ExbD
MILRDGKVFFGSDQVTADQLSIHIRGALKPGVESKVYIRTDARAKYGTVKESRDGVRDAGVENIAFLADQGRSPTP